ncbi:MAG TPA: winged helix DNA-binding protein [Gemmatimonadaceae bacterium]
MRDSAILAHLDERVAVTPAALAAHLDVSPSTLSEALKRLASLGFVSQRDGSGTPRRRTRVLLTEKGAAAVRDTSVLEPDRLTRALSGLSRAELRAVARGMQTLGDACLRQSAPARSQTVDMLPNANGRTRYRETGKNGSILYEVERSTPDRELVGRIADQSLPFGGTWTFTLTPGDAGTTLSITEDGEVYNPLFRFVSRFVMGYDSTIDTYLRDIAKRVGQGNIAITNA